MDFLFKDLVDFNGRKYSYVIFLVQNEHDLQEDTLSV